MILECFIERTDGGLYLQPAASNLTGPSVHALPPKFVPEGQMVAGVPYTTLEAHVDDLVVWDLEEKTMVFSTMDKKKKSK